MLIHTNKKSKCESTSLEFKANNINDFERFINEVCNIGEQYSVSYISLKNQYKIWAKTANHKQLKLLTDYVKTKCKTFYTKYNPLVSTSKFPWN